jgi:predicted O-methyltransferase YrrM
MLPDHIRRELNFCPELLEILETGVTLARDGSQTAVHSTSTLNNLLVLKGLFAKTKATSTLEIGLGYGASCSLLAACHRATGASPARQHVGMDPLQDTYWKDATPFLLERAKLDGYVEVLRRPSSLELPLLELAGRKFDLIYVDGSHLFEDVFVDFYHCRQLLRTGGIIVFDDCSYPHIAKVLKFISTSLRGHYTEVDVSSHRPDLGKNIKYRVGKLLGKVQLRAFQLTGEAERSVHSPFVNF